MKMDTPQRPDYLAGLPSCDRALGCLESGACSRASPFQLWMHAKRPVGAVIGMVGQFAVLPAIGFCLSIGFRMQPYESLGVLIISCCPGGALSNFFTFWADGDVALR